MTSSTVSQVWVLKVGEQAIAVTPRELKEILEVGKLTPVPLAPPLLLGLLSNQGNVLPVIALGQMLGLSAGSQLAAVVEHQGSSVALAISEVVGLSPWYAEASSQEALGQYGLEAAQLGGKTVVRLNLAALMQSIRQQVQTANAR